MDWWSSLRGRCQIWLNEVIEESRNVLECCFALAMYSLNTATSELNIFSQKCGNFGIYIFSKKKSLALDFFVPKCQKFPQKKETLLESWTPRHTLLGCIFQFIKNKFCASGICNSKISYWDLWVKIKPVLTGYFFFVNNHKVVFSFGICFWQTHRLSISNFWVMGGLSENTHICRLQ